MKHWKPGKIVRKNVKIGEYVLVHQWSDLDPCDPWEIGFLAGIQIDKDGQIYRVSKRWFNHCRIISIEDGKKFIKAKP